MRNIWLGKKLQTLTIGFGLGACVDMWNAMHSKQHAATEKVYLDMDLDTVLVVAFFNTAFEKSRTGRVGLSALWIRLQALTFLPVTTGALVMAFWLRFLHPQRVVKSGKWDEGVAMNAATSCAPTSFSNSPAGRAWPPATRWASGPRQFCDWITLANIHRRHLYFHLSHCCISTCLLGQC